MKHVARRAPLLCLLLAGCLAYSLTLKMEAVIFSVTSVNSFQITEGHIPVNHIFILATARTSNPKFLISDMKQSFRIK
jgi:hypothetical protein